MGQGGGVWTYFALLAPNICGQKGIVPLRGLIFMVNLLYSKTCLKQPLKKTENWFSRPIIANEGQKYCRNANIFDLH